MNDSNEVPSPETHSLPNAWWKYLRWPRWMPMVVGVLAALLLVAVIVRASTRIFDIIQPVFVPMLVSAALAYLIKPLVTWFMKRRFKRPLAVMLAMCIAALVLVALILALLPLGSQLSQATTKIPETARNLNQWIQPRLESLHTRYPVLYDKTVEQVMEKMKDPSGLIEPVVGAAGAAFSNVFGVVGSVLNLILIPFFVYYLLADGSDFRDRAVDLVPPRHQRVARALIKQIDGVLSNYVRGQLLVCLAMGVMYSLIFWLLGVPSWLALGMLSGFGHLVPYVGTLAAGVLTVVLTAFDQPSLLKILGVIAAYPIVQSTEGFVLTPWILGDRLELHPFLVIVGLIVAHHLFGILGIILAVPTLATGKVVFEFLYEEYRQSSFYRFRAAGEEPSVALDADVEAVESRR